MLDYNNVSILSIDNQKWFAGSSFSHFSLENNKYLSPYNYKF